MKKRLLTGLQPSGTLTLGNFCGGINQVYNYQEEYDTFLFIPDLHSITVTQDPEELHKKIKEVVGLYLACGIDAQKTHIYIQSENLYHANLSWILECHAYFGELSRMHQFKEKSKNKENFTCGLYTYPILMASDILLYDAQVVPTGIDQKQHVELARNIAERFNNRYHGNYFVIPEPLIPNVGAKIRDLQNPEKKMSKSTSNPKSSIFLLDEEKAIRKKIMGAVTDNDASIKFDEENKPGVSNLLTIYSVLKNISIDEAVRQFSGAGYGDLKKEVANVTIEKIMSIQEKYHEIMSSNVIDDILDEGRDYTNKLASEKYETIRKAVGLGR